MMRSVSLLVVLAGLMFAAGGLSADVAHAAPTGKSCLNNDWKPAVDCKSFKGTYDACQNGGWASASCKSDRKKVFGIAGEGTGTKTGDTPKEPDTRAPCKAGTKNCATKAIDGGVPPAKGEVCTPGTKGCTTRATFCDKPANRKNPGCAGVEPTNAYCKKHPKDATCVAKSKDSGPKSEVGVSGEGPRYSGEAFEPIKRVAAFVLRWLWAIVPGAIVLSFLIAALLFTVSGGNRRMIELGRSQLIATLVVTALVAGFFALQKIILSFAGVS